MSTLRALEGDTAPQLQINGGRAMHPRVYVETGDYVSVALAGWGFPAEDRLARLFASSEELLTLAKRVRVLAMLDDRLAPLCEEVGRLIGYVDGAKP